jgi:glutamate-1-semialdehyde 2,1-aminomutase
MHALRMARAFTNREVVVKFEGQYHGFHDYMLFSTAYTAYASTGSARSPIPVPNSSGIPAALRQLVIVLPYNDFEMLEQTLRARWGEIAAIIVEPVAGNMTSIPPVPGWLEHIRKLCDTYGIVMIMDEVKTGFRIARGGATEYFGVKGRPDNLRQIAGQRLSPGGHCRERRGDVCHRAGAHGPRWHVLRQRRRRGSRSSHLEIIETTPALETVAQRGQRLMDGLHAELQAAGVEHVMTGIPGMFTFVLGFSKQPLNYRDLIPADAHLYEKLALSMRKRGVEYELDHKEPWFICEAHSEADIDHTLEVFRDCLKELP